MPALTPPHTPRCSDGRWRGAKKTHIPRRRRAISGRRYYNSSQGRFLGRDPVEEKGGANLYGFCGNNSVNRWDVLGMEPDYAPTSVGEVYRGVEIRDGVIYNVTYQAVSTGMEGVGNEVTWAFVGEWRGGTVNVDAEGNATRGIPETQTTSGDPTDTTFGSISFGAVTNVPVVRQPVQPTRSITFLVAFDSSVTVTDALRALVQANVDTFQTLLNGTPGLSNIRASVKYVDNVSIAAPTGRNYDFTSTYTPGGIFRRGSWTPWSNASATAGQAAISEAGGVGIPVLVTGGTITIDGFRSTDPAHGVAAFTSYGGFVITTAGLRSATGARIFAHETGHVGNYSDPASPRRRRDHSQVPGNIMTEDHSGMGTDPNYVTAINRVAIPIP